MESLCFDLSATNVVKRYKMVTLLFTYGEYARLDIYHGQEAIFPDTEWTGNAQKFLG